MVAGAQVTAFRRALLRRIQGATLGRAALTASLGATLPVAGLRARQFAVLASNDRPDSHQTSLERLTEAAKPSWRLRAAVKDVETSLPRDRGRRFYNRRVLEALEAGDLNRAWAVIETLHRRHPEKLVLWPYTYNLVMRHYCKQQKTLVNSNLNRILALLDVMVAQGCADQTSVEVAMAASSRARHLRSAKYVVQKMHESGKNLDGRMYGFLINCCARKRGLVKQAEQYFAEMIREGVAPTIAVINSMLRVYSRDSGRSDAMLALVKRAGDEFGLVPNSVTSRTMAYYLLNEGNVDTAVKFLHDVETAFPPEASIELPIGRRVVNAVVDACRQRGEWDLAECALGLGKRSQRHPTNDSDVKATTMLEQLISKRDALAKAVVWALDEQDWSRMSRSDQKEFLLHQSQRESIERSWEQMQSRTTHQKTDRAIEKLSLKLESKLHLLDEIISAEDATVTDFYAVLGACGRQGKLAEGVSVLTKMKNYAVLFPECTPTTWGYNALLNACAVRGDVNQIEPILNELIERELQPDQVTMNTVLKAYVTSLKCAGENSQARLNTVMQGLSFFEWCTEDEKINPGAATYYSLFRLFTAFLERPEGIKSDAGSDELSDDLDDEEFVDGQEGELMAWMTEFITTTCRDVPLESLDTGVFNSAFAYYHQLGDVDESFALFNLMKKRGIQPDDTTMGLMFATCASQQQFEVGLKLLDHIMAVDGYKPTLKVLSGAMQLCANAKNPDGALELFRAIETSGAFRPTIETYEPLVFAYARVGNVTSAWDIANEMEKNLGRVSVSIYNRILLACAEAALPGRALEVLDVIRHKDGTTADTISYNTALEAFVRAGERAAWWRKNKTNLAEDDDDLDFDDDDNEMESTELLGDIDNKKNLGQTNEDSAVMVNPPRDFKLEQREKAVWVRAKVVGLLEEMQRNGLEPDATTYERALAACSVNDDFEGVICIFDTLINRLQGKDSIELKSGLVSDSSLSAYLAACTLLNDKDRVLEVPILLHKWHTATAQFPPVFVVAQLMDSLDEVGEWRRAVRMLPDMKALFGFPPSVAVFNRVMQMCNDAGEHHLVAPIFATMQDASAYRIFPDVGSYIQRIYAEEQRENWVAATDLFVEMQKNCPSEEISHQQLQKIALGRYRIRQNGP
ncbi:unnamed protein product [Phytophthora fragariaefolia]|uniref:Unnamed protein product n=1 Tax=Phytophthora fragariaefolia TaxID=1490495 RepID=A0A9W6U3W4_9STRA|nr:unnamed protein product [Phytophthora fragariaefolia]